MMRSARLIARKDSALTRTLSLLTFFAFAATCIVTPAEASALAQTQGSQAESARVKQLTPPAELGTITDAHIVGDQNSTQSPVVIHIQDLHANYQTQAHIAKILDFLDARLGAGHYKVAIEGAEGPLLVAELGKIENRDFKAKVCDRLMKEAELTGTEYFSIVNSKTDVLVGAEDERYHQANIALFQKTYEGKQEIVKAINGVEADLKPIKNKFYDRAMRKFDQKETDLASHKIFLEEYLPFVAHLARKHGIDVVRQYPEVAKEIGALRADRYGNIDTLLTEKNALTAAVRDRMAKNDVQRNLFQVEKELGLLKRFMMEQVTTAEVREIAPKLSEIAGHAQALLDSVDADYNRSNLEQLVSAGLDYYVIALARDKYLTENALKLFSKSSSPLEVVVLVAGGFHTPGISKLLKEKGVSYITVTPNVSEQSDHERRLYIARLMDEHPDPNIFAAGMGRMLSPDLNGGMAGFAARVFQGVLRFTRSDQTGVADRVVRATPAPRIQAVTPADMPEAFRVGGALAMPLVPSQRLVQAGDRFSIDFVDSLSDEVFARAMSVGATKVTANPFSASHAALKGELNSLLPDIDPTLMGWPLLWELQKARFRQQLPNVEVSIELDPTVVSPFQLKLEKDAKGEATLETIKDAEGNLLLKPEYAAMVGKDSLGPTEQLPAEVARKIHDDMVQRWVAQAIEIHRLGDNATVKIGNTRALAPWMGTIGEQVGADVVHALAVLGIHRNFTLGFRLEDADLSLHADQVSRAELASMHTIDLEKGGVNAVAAELLSRIADASHSDSPRDIVGKGRSYYSHFASRVDGKINSAKWKGKLVSDQASAWVGMVSLLQVIVARYSGLPAKNQQAVIPASLAPKVATQRGDFYMRALWGGGHHVVPTAPQKVMDSFNQQASIDLASGAIGNILDLRNPLSDAMKKFQVLKAAGKSDLEAAQEVLTDRLSLPDMVGSRDQAAEIVQEILALPTEKAELYQQFVNELYVEGDATFQKPHLQAIAATNEFAVKARIPKPVDTFADHPGLQGREKWVSMEPGRQAKWRRFFGAQGIVASTPADHNNPEGHYGQTKNMTAEEAQLMIFNTMEGHSFLFHPESMLGRRNQAGEWVNLKKIAADAKAAGQSTAVFAALNYGALELNPKLPAGKQWIVKWEANKTPNGTKTDDETAIGNVPRNQGEELGVTLAEIGTIPEVVGVKYMTYVDSSRPDSYEAIGKEVKAQSIAAHEAGLLFFPEDLPAKTANGRPLLSDEKKGIVGFKEEDPLGYARWSANNALLFAKMLKDFNVDYDAYKFTFPGTPGTEKNPSPMTDEEVIANLKRMKEYVGENVLMMLSGGDEEDVFLRKLAMATEYLNVSGTFAGRSIWKDAFNQKAKENPVPPVPADAEGKARVMEIIRHNLSKAGVAGERYGRLMAQMLSSAKPFWVHFGLTPEEAGVVPVRDSFADHPGLQGREKWVSMEPGRQAKWRRFFGAQGIVASTPADHNNPEGHYGQTKNMTAEEAQLMIFNTMEGHSFLFHPESMLGRRNQAGEWVNLKKIAADAKAAGQSTAVFAALNYGALELNPKLPAGKQWIVKWEANKTPNGTKTDDETAIGNVPRNQGEELGVTLAEIGTIPEVVGVKYMTYVDSSRPDSYEAIGKEVKAQSIAAHEAGLLFFPEDLPAKTANGRPLLSDEKKGIVGFKEEDPLGYARWSANNALLFAKMLKDFNVDYDAYKFTFPGTPGTEKNPSPMTDEEVIANLKRMKEYVGENVLMMLSGGDEEDVFLRKLAMATEYLNVSGTFAGRSIWKDAFNQKAKENPVPPVPADAEGKARVMEIIRHNLSKAGVAGERYGRLMAQMLSSAKPFWVHFGLTEAEAKFDASVVGSLPDSHKVKSLEVDFSVGQMPSGDQSWRLERKHIPTSQLATQWMAAVGTHVGDRGAAAKLEGQVAEDRNEQSDLYMEAVQDAVAQKLGEELHHIGFETKFGSEGAITKSQKVGVEKVTGRMGGTIRAIISDVVEWTSRFGADKPYSSSIRVQGPGTISFGSFPDSARAICVVTHINPELEAQVLRDRGARSVEELLDPELDAAVLAENIAALNGVSPEMLEITVQPNGVKGKDLETGREVVSLRKLQRDFPGLDVHPIKGGTVRPAKPAGWGVRTPSGKIQVYLGRAGMTETWEETVGLAPFANEGSIATFKPVSEKIRANWGDRNNWDDKVRKEIEFHRAPLVTNPRLNADAILNQGTIFSNRQVVGNVEGSYTFMTDAPADYVLPISEKGPEKVRGNVYRTVTINFASNPNGGKGFMWKSRDEYYVGSVSANAEPQVKAAAAMPWRWGVGMLVGAGLAVLLAPVAALWVVALAWGFSAFMTVGFLKGLWISRGDLFKAVAVHTNAAGADLIFQAEEVMHQAVRLSLGLPGEHEFESLTARFADEVVSMTLGFFLFSIIVPVLVATAIANLAMSPEQRINNDLVNALETIRQLGDSFPQMGQQMAVTTNGVLIRFGLRRPADADEIRRRLLEPVQMSA